MRELTQRQVNAGLDKATEAVSNENLFELLVNMSYLAITSGRINTDRVAEIASSNLPGVFRSACNKYLPVAFDKEQQKYKLKREKIVKILKKLGFEQDGLADCKQTPDFEKYFTFEEFAANFPNPFEKVAEKKSSEDSVEKVAKNVSNRLTKLGIAHAEDIAQVIQLLASRPDLIKEISAKVI